MIDPVTALSVAASAVSQMKTLISAGRDASQAMGKFAGAWSDISYAESRAKNPPWYMSFTGSAEKEALELYTAKRKMMEMRKEVESLISFMHGPKGLEEYKETIRRVRKDRQKHEYRKQEIKRAILEWTVGVIAVSSGIALIAWVLYLIGLDQGRW